VARRELTDIPGRDLPRDGELNGVGAVLAAGDEQAGHPGLRATLALEHHGDEAISLLNPFEMVQWQLLDERGAPLPVPQRAPSLLVIGDQAGSWIEEGPLRVVEVHRGREALATAALDTRTVLLEPSDHLAATFELHRLAGGEPLTGGTYAIGCVATLIDADHPDRSRILRADPVQVSFRPGGRPRATTA
jgi:hypothetical protein